MIFRRFGQDERGSVPRRFANIAFVAAIAAVAAASMLDRLTKDGGSSLIAFLLPQDPATLTRADHSQIAQDGTLRGIDPTPTGSIRPVVLDPCTGRQK